MLCSEQTDRVPAGLQLALRNSPTQNPLAICKIKIMVDSADYKRLRMLLK